MRNGSRNPVILLPRITGEQPNITISQNHNVIEEGWVEYFWESIEEMTVCILVDNHFYGMQMYSNVEENFWYNFELYYSEADDEITAFCYQVILDNFDVIIEYVKQYLSILLFYISQCSVPPSDELNWVTTELSPCRDMWIVVLEYTKNA